MSEVIKLTFAKEKATVRTIRYREELGEQAWSDKDVAIGPLYVQKHVVEMLGNPEKIDVTLTAHKEA